ncbi:MAG: hypothetical protein JO210_16640 [Acidobacteriaceae bacterium]|nr:hypothetical protein [Acidobacteriaceae bacterium]
MGLLLLLSDNGTQSSVIPITSIADISGPTINFEQPGDTVDAIFPVSDMVALPDASIQSALYPRS